MKRTTPLGNRHTHSHDDTVQYLDLLGARRLALLLRALRLAPPRHLSLRLRRTLLGQCTCLVRLLGLAARRRRRLGVVHGARVHGEAGRVQLVELGLELGAIGARGRVQSAGARLVLAAPREQLRELGVQAVALGLRE